MTASPLRSEVATLRDCWLNTTTRWNTVPASSQRFVVSLRRRSLTATVNRAYSLPDSLAPCSGSPVRLPSIVTGILVVILLPSLQETRRVSAGVVLVDPRVPFRLVGLAGPRGWPERVVLARAARPGAAETLFGLGEAFVPTYGAKARVVLVEGCLMQDVQGRQLLDEFAVLPPARRHHADRQVVSHREPLHPLTQRRPRN